MKKAYVEAVETYCKLYKIGFDTVKNYDKDAHLVDFDYKELLR
jgi:hypothetical protein